MKYEVSFTAGIRDKEGPTHVTWWAVQEVEVERLSDLIPLLTSVEKMVEEWRNARERP